jgi:GTPase SAR1 family protein
VLWLLAAQLLVGNKCDMQSTRVVSHEKGEQMAKRHNMGYFETSAKINHKQCVEEAFIVLAMAIKEA